MAPSEELEAAQRSLDELTRSVGRLEQRISSGLEIRRVRADADHLRESLALLREAAFRQESPPTTPLHSETVIIPDAPYDAALWADADDEGLGACDRRAP